MRHGHDGGNFSRQKIAVIGAGISGLSAAWLLARRHDVTLYDRESRLGGHSNTSIVHEHAGEVAVDTGFIVFNPLNYPNLTRLFDHLGVETAPSDMSFAVSLDGGSLEYGGGSLSSLFAQRRNLASPRFWSMLRDLTRFYRSAPKALRAGLDEGTSLGEFLARYGYGDAFTRDHLLPMAGAIWSSAPETLASYPAAAFIRFFENHGLLKLSDRPPWRTVAGGSRRYVEKLAQGIANCRTGARVDSVRREGGQVIVTAGGEAEVFDRVLIATHADEALAILADPSAQERELLTPFGYTRNTAVLHTDARLMPRRRQVWSSWNYLGERAGAHRDVCVTYWMNRLQPLATATDYFVTLNPVTPPAAGSVVATYEYDHPVFTSAAMAAQRRLGDLQGRCNTWFAGAWFGSGFHEDGLRSGLDAAEAMGAGERPWACSAAAREAWSPEEAAA